MPTAWLLNTAWMAGGAREAAAFRRAAGNPRSAQEILLRRLVEENRDTLYGRQHNFARIRTVQDFQQQAPIVGYESLRPFVDRIAAGEPNVLTSEPVRLLEPTGGTSGGEKLIPYTDTLRRQFQRAVAVWIYDVMRRNPAARRGRAYWSISPATQRPRVTAGGVRIGFESDADYLGGWQRWAAGRLLVAPPQLAHLRSMENFRYATLLYLLASRDLALVSIWSPTFLTTLLDDLPRRLDRICDDLRLGRVRLPQSGDEGASSRLPLRRDRDRASRLSHIFRSSAPLTEKLRQTWPRLALVSCWADAAAAAYVPRLRELLPHAAFQPKGLLATEGVISFPLVSHDGAALAVRSHFFEFLETDDNAPNDARQQAPQLADELEPNRRYRVLLTTGGGLYRYDLGDEVEVVDHYRRCPLIRFVGRSGAVSDLVGEKLHERHVREALGESFREFAVQPDFAMLVPAAVDPPRYQLLLNLEGAGASNIIPRLAEAVEQRLHENPQYRYAVELGQLAPVQVCLLNHSPGHAWRIYEQHCLGRGQKAGDIKPTSLHPWSGWAEALRTPA